MINASLTIFSLYRQMKKEELAAILKEWEGRTFEDLTAIQYSQEELDALEVGVMTKGVSKQSTMCMNPDYPEMVKVGYRYYIEECREKLETLEREEMTLEKMNQKYTWQAMIIAMEAIIDFAHRYADLAEKWLLNVRMRSKKQSF